MKKRLLSILLACAMVVGLTACGGGATTETAPEAATEESAEATTTEAGDETPLVVGYAPFSSKFSPFFAESAYDQDTQEVTQVSLLENDRQGAIIFKVFRFFQSIRINFQAFCYCAVQHDVCTCNAVRRTQHTMAPVPCMLFQLKVWKLTVPVWKHVTT